MKKILLLSLTLIFATELEVDGNLKVTGNINASGNPVKNIGLPTTLNDAINGNALQDALRDDGNYEYKFILGKIAYFHSSNNNVERYSQYMILSEVQVGASYWTDGLSQVLNQHSSDGWQIEFLSAGQAEAHATLLYQLKRPLEDSE
tara:strand:+ start:179 stop:619 length:441 start_codon:yes stop_codon:yes gene_type:complete